jgi:hypothetical protein
LAVRPYVKVGPPLWKCYHIHVMMST